MSTHPPCQKAAVIGGGVIGAGWVARLLQNGVAVKIYDPDTTAPRKLGEVLENAARARAALFPQDESTIGVHSFAGTIAEAVSDAELVIESVPERVALKRDVHQQIDDAAPPTALVTSSTSGIKPTEIQAGLQHAARVLVAHPFNPVYLLPLVELCGGEATAPANIQHAKQLFVELGMHPLIVRNEIDGFIADRLMEALWREALWLVHDGVATTQEIDDAVRYGAGLRWAMMGTFQTFWLAGGEGGMRAMLQQFGPCLQWPWTHLTDVPELTDTLIDTISNQCDAQAEGVTPRAMERRRDDGLVKILRALEECDWGAGRTVAEYRKRRSHLTKAV